MNLKFKKVTVENCEQAIKIYDDNYNLKTDILKLKNQILKLESNLDYYNIVVYLDDTVVGMFTAIVNQDIVEELNPFLTVWNLAVAKEFRRKGIAMQMLDYIFDLAKELGCDFVSLIAESNNKEAIELYKKAAYKEEIGFVKLVNRKNW